MGGSTPTVTGAQFRERSARSGFNPLPSLGRRASSPLTSSHHTQPQPHPHSLRCPRPRRSGHRRPVGQRSAGRQGHCPARLGTQRALCPSSPNSEVTAGNRRQRQAAPTAPPGQGTALPTHAHLRPSLHSSAPPQLSARQPGARKSPLPAAALPRSAGNRRAPVKG